MSSLHWLTGSLVPTATEMLISPTRVAPPRPLPALGPETTTVAKGVGGSRECSGWRTSSVHSRGHSVEGAALRAPNQHHHW
jgi:hypothetical protein